MFQLQKSVYDVKADKDVFPLSSGNRANNSSTSS